MNVDRLGDKGITPLIYLTPQKVTIQLILRTYRTIHYFAATNNLIYVGFTYKKLEVD